MLVDYVQNSRVVVVLTVGSQVSLFECTFFVEYPAVLEKYKAERKVDSFENGGKMEKKGRYSQ